MIPESEGFMRINGESTSERVENIEFSGIQFSYDHYSLEVIDDPENDMHAIGYGGVQSLGLYRKFADHGNWHHSWYNIVDTPYAAVDVQTPGGSFLRATVSRIFPAPAASAIPTMWLIPPYRGTPLSTLLERDEYWASPACVHRGGCQER